MQQVEKQKTSPLWKRTAWMIAIYLLSVIALGVISCVFKLAMYAAGMRLQ